jgi:AraC-like DNA-binding protein
VAEDLRRVPDRDRAVRTWQAAIEYIEEHLHRELSRDQVAKALGVHPNYLSTLCSRHGGESFHRTVEEMRLARARILLDTDRDLRIADVARRVGFNDPGYFNRVFRNRQGESPGRWRKR